jgi:hypothetical protein
MAIDTTDKTLYTGDGERVFVVVLETRSDYPPVHGTAQPRQLAEDDITTMTLNDAAALVALGRVRYFEGKQ